MNVSDLRDDFSSGNFDNNGNAPFMSFDQIEKYLVIVRKAVSHAVNRETLNTPQVIRIEPGIKVNEYITRRHDEYIRRNKAALNYEKAEAAGSSQTPKDFGVVYEQEVFFAKDHYNRFYATYEHYLKNPLSKSGVMPSF